MRRFAPFAVAALAACGGGYSSGAAPAPDPEPTAVHYAPATVSYRSVEHRHVEQEINGQTTQNDRVSTTFLGTMIAAAADGFTVTIVVDSVTVTGGAQFSSAEVAAARGTVFSGTLAPTGQVEAIAGGDTTQPFIAQLRRGIEEFYPRIPAGGVEPGRSWTDTTAVVVNSGGLDLNIESIDQYEAIEWTEHAGVRVIRIHVASSYTIAGEGEQTGQPMMLDGTGRRHVDQFLAGDGRFVGAIAADTAEVEVVLTNLGLIVPVKQTVADTLAVVR